jgi:hypothetical protein
MFNINKNAKNVTRKISLHDLSNICTNNGIFKVIKFLSTAGFDESFPIDVEREYEGERVIGYMFQVSDSTGKEYQLCLLTTLDLINKFEEDNRIEPLMVLAGTNIQIRYQIITGTDIIVTSSNLVKIPEDSYLDIQGVVHGITYNKNHYVIDMLPDEPLGDMSEYPSLKIQEPTKTISYKVLDTELPYISLFNKVNVRVLKGAAAASNPRIKPRFYNTQIISIKYSPGCIDFDNSTVSNCVDIESEHEPSGDIYKVRILEKDYFSSVFTQVKQMGVYPDINEIEIKGEHIKAKILLKKKSSLVLKLQED